MQKVVSIVPLLVNNNNNNKEFKVVDKINKYNFKIELALVDRPSGWIN